MIIRITFNNEDVKKALSLYFKLPKQSTITDWYIASLLDNGNYIEYKTRDVKE
jgi:hypothetical protein